MLRNISFVLFVSVFLSSCITNNDLSIINTKGTEPLETFQFDYKAKIERKYYQLYMIQWMEYYINNT